VLSVCGTWPAFWTANIPNWPDGGEIDIMEGVNNQDYYNHWAFHVGGTCSIAGGTQSAEIDTYNCNVYAPDQSSNAGCGGYATTDATYGDEMNDYGGGVYAMDWRSTGIRIWEFPPNAIPSDIQSGKPTTSGWGEVTFPSPSIVTDFPSQWWIYAAESAILATIFTIIKSFLISRILLIEESTDSQILW
jgi:hypothetical protein